MISRLRTLLASKPVANTGSQLRDHQANERTFLSWTRMGLAFAAMALALGRLGLIDQVFHSHIALNNPSPTPKSSTTKDEPPSHQANGSGNEILASQACWTISVWSFGYGIFRYVTVQRNLLKGRFVPAVWGPVLMTAGSLGSLGAIVRMDLRGAHSRPSHKKE